MEVMPIYMTNIMIMGIAVGMACFNEIRFYAVEQLACIAVAIITCICGIMFLLKKSAAVGK